MRGTWQDELGEWIGEQAAIIDGKDPKARAAQVADAAAREGAWLIVNWEKLRLMPELAKVKWAAVVADEAHRAKNRKAKQARALWKLRAPVQLALTGTPIFNSPDELWSLLKWLYPKVYTSYWRFYEEYVEYVEQHFGAHKGKVVTGVKNVDALRFELSDKLVRRTKREVLPDLPAKLPPQIIYTNMGTKQRKLYEQVKKQLWVEVQQEADTADSPGAAIDAIATGNLLMLPNAATRTTRLRQVSSTPATLGAPDDSAKLDACVDYISDLDDERKAVVFCEFTDTCDALVRRLEGRKSPISAAPYHGKVADDVREGLKGAFQNEDEPRVLVCTPETGGVGLTLTRANVAILVDEEWVPALNQQAQDRLHRIGQEREVHVIVFRNRNSIDTLKVAPTLERKDRIVSAIIKQDD